MSRSVDESVAARPEIAPTANCASEGSATTSAVARPDGSLLCWQPYGKSGLLIADLDLAEATCLLASRARDY